MRVLTMKTVSGKPGEEFIYMTDPIPTPPVPADEFATNGLVDLLSLSGDSYIAVERAFTVGVGNDVKLYVTTTHGATNVHDMKSIEGKNIKPMSKHLLLDLVTVGITLDNIESVTFGPELEDGSKTLILVSDNNFNPDGQFTQFLAFRMHQ